MEKKKRKKKKVKNYMLGSGLLGGAARSLKGRKSKIDAAVDGAVKRDYKAK